MCSPELAKTRSLAALETTCWSVVRVPTSSSAIQATIEFKVATAMMLYGAEAASIALRAETATMLLRFAVALNAVADLAER